MGISRQLLAAYISSALGLLVGFGIVPHELADSVRANPETAIGVVMVFYSVLLWFFRLITRTPLVGRFLFKLKVDQ